MASRRNLMRPVPRLRDVLERIERNEVRLLLLGMPVADPFLDLDLGTSSDAAGAAPAAVAPFGFAPPASPVHNPRRMPDTLSGRRGDDVLIGGAGSDTLGSLGEIIFDDDPVGGVAFGSLPLRNPQRASGAIIGSGGARPEELARQDDGMNDQRARQQRRYFRVSDLRSIRKAICLLSLMASSLRSSGQRVSRHKEQLMRLEIISSQDCEVGDRSGAGSGDRELCPYSPPD